MEFCGLSQNQQLEASNNLCKWNHKEVTWSVLNDVPPFTRTQVEDVVEEAMDMWTKDFDINPKKSTGARTNIPIKGNPIDGRGRILARQFLPCSNPPANAILPMEIDTSRDEIWVLKNNPRPGEINLFTVILHELGHAWGIPHQPTGVMRAQYQLLLELLKDDLNQMGLRYPEVSFPDPDPDPVFPNIVAEGEFRILATGELKLFPK